MVFIKVSGLLIASLFSFASLAALSGGSQGSNSLRAQSQQADFRGLLNMVDGPNLLSDSGVDFPKYDDLEFRLTQLAARHPSVAELVHYGKTVEGRNLNLLRIGAKNPANGANQNSAIEISGAIHGNEYLGIEEPLAVYFLDHQDQMPGLQSYLQTGGVIYFVPVVNPDGFEIRQRLNHNGSDLNRDFALIPRREARFSQPETTALARFIEDDLNAHHLQLKMSLDYHCCVPAFITPWTYLDAQPSPMDLPAIHAITQVQKGLLNYDAGNAKDTVGYLAEGSTIDYFYARYGTLAFTIEGKDGGEMDVFAQHIRFWDKMFQDIAKLRPSNVIPSGRLAN